MDTRSQFSLQRRTRVRCFCCCVNVYCICTCTCKYYACIQTCNSQSERASVVCLTFPALVAEAVGNGAPWVSWRRLECTLFARGVCAWVGRWPRGTWIAKAKQTQNKRTAGHREWFKHNTCVQFGQILCPRPKGLRCCPCNQDRARPGSVRGITAYLRDSAVCMLQSRCT